MARLPTHDGVSPTNLSTGADLVSSPPHISFQEAARSPLFPNTAWSRVTQAAESGGPADLALDGLCSIYREPARKYLIMLGCRPEEAEDLTQEFLLRWATPETMQRLSPGVGKLRSYIRQALRNLLVNARRDASTQRRGGVQEPLSLHETDTPSEAEADSVLDTEWALALLREVIAGLREAYVKRGKSEVFDRLSATLFDPDSLQPYAEIGASLGIQEVQVKLEVHRLRRRFGEALRAAVATTVSDPTEIDDELRHLLRAASRAGFS